MVKKLFLLICCWLTVGMHAMEIEQSRVDNMEQEYARNARVLLWTNRVMRFAPLMTTVATMVGSSLICSIFEKKYFTNKHAEKLRGLAEILTNRDIAVMAHPMQPQSWLSWFGSGCTWFGQQVFLGTCISLFVSGIHASVAPHRKSWQTEIMIPKSDSWFISEQPWVLDNVVIPCVLFWFVEELYQLERAVAKNERNEIKSSIEKLLGHIQYQHNALAVDEIRYRNILWDARGDIKTQANQLLATTDPAEITPCMAKIKLTLKDLYQVPAYKVVS